MESTLKYELCVSISTEEEVIQFNSKKHNIILNPKIQFKETTKHDLVTPRTKK